MLTQDLVQLGLTEKEARLYITMLHIGPSPASALARRSHMKRASVYSVLESLTAQGLVHFEERNQCRYYLALDPECLLYPLNEQSARLKRQVQLAKRCISRLHEMSRVELIPKQKAIFLQGRMAVEQGMQDWLDPSRSLSVLMLDWDSNSTSAHCVHDFLKKHHLSPVHLFVCQKALMTAQKRYPHFQCKGLVSKRLVKGEMLMQGNKVLLVLENGADLQMMCLNDPAYANYLKEILFEPISS